MIYLIATIAVLCGYLIGSLPSGYLIVRCKKGIDLRTVGSGSTGATNVSRVLGTKYFFVVTLIDVLKGLIAILLASLITGKALDSWVCVGAGFASILGHIFPVWLKFKAGKGVNTALGVAVTVFPAGVLMALLVFGIVFGISRIVSASSMSAGVFYLVSALAMRFYFGRDISDAVLAFAIFLPILLIYSHRENINRLIKGQENVYGSNR